MSISHISIKNGRIGNGARHARYIAGAGSYAAREDVVLVEDGNLPTWAKDSEVFFAASDEYERGDHERRCRAKDGREYIKTIRGRSYKELEVAIPREAADPVMWAQDFRKEIIGEKHPYRFVVHDKEARDGGRNIHMHLMFSTRALDGYERNREAFFKRAAATYRDRKTKELVESNPAVGGALKSKFWDSRDAVKSTRAQFEKHVQRVDPTFQLRRSDTPEPKIGPVLVRGGREYEAKMAARQEKVGELRTLRHEREDREREALELLADAKRQGEQQRVEGRGVLDLSSSIADAKFNRVEQAELYQHKRRNDLFTQIFNTPERVQPKGEEVRQIEEEKKSTESGMAHHRLDGGRVLRIVQVREYKQRDKDRDCGNDQ